MGNRSIHDLHRAVYYQGYEYRHLEASSGRDFPGGGPQGMYTLQWAFSGHVTQRAADSCSGLDTTAFRDVQILVADSC